MILTIFLVLVTCNTWSGVCGEPVRHQWSQSVPGWGTPTIHLRAAIEKCRIRGVGLAYRYTAVSDAHGNRHATTNVDCTYKIGRGT